MLFYILSLSRLGSISQGLGQWHASLYLITPWQYTPRLGMLIMPCQYLPRLAGLGMLFYILSRLGSVRRGLACYSISYHALAVSASWQGLEC